MTDDQAPELAGDEPGWPLCALILLALGTAAAVAVRSNRLRSRGPLC